MSVSDPPPAPITRPRLPWKPVSLPWITPRWSAASIALTASSKGLGSWPSRVPSSASMLERLQHRPSGAGMASFSISMWASRATKLPSSSWASGLISASVMSRSLEEARQPRQDRREPVERGARNPGRGDHLLGLEVREGEQVGEVAAAHVVRVLLGHLLDVDPAHVAEQHQRALAGAVPDDAGVVLLLHLRPSGPRAPRAACRHRSRARGWPPRARPPRPGCRRTGRRRPSSARRVSTCDLITVGPPIRAAIVRASSGVLAKPKSVTGIPASRDDRARFVLVEAHGRRGTLPGCRVVARQERDSKSRSAISRVQGTRARTSTAT